MVSDPSPVYTPLKKHSQQSLPPKSSYSNKYLNKKQQSSYYNNIRTPGPPSSKTAAGAEKLLLDAFPPQSTRFDNYQPELAPSSERRDRGHGSTSSGNRPSRKQQNDIYANLQDDGGSKLVW